MHVGVRSIPVSRTTCFFGLCRPKHTKEEVSSTSQGSVLPMRTWHKSDMETAWSIAEVEEPWKVSADLPGCAGVNFKSSLLCVYSHPTCYARVACALSQAAASIHHCQAHTPNVLSTYHPHLLSQPALFQPGSRPMSLTSCSTTLRVQRTRT